MSGTPTPIRREKRWMFGQEVLVKIYAPNDSGAEEADFSWGSGKSSPYALAATLNNQQHSESL
ncbi:hypothetical protein PN36_35025 [Candidatus Thiomargarita nelsonii]|uniref:Uncharacterized protein n=1 Tax=Candidatus Thiomargarita nelsonii TaxID=1003181 RepID=A0A4E0RKN9_9GAMM|nr:hypothetical protein PN36_35025 [Candidatus Thiomargarita nelsonii]